MTKIGPLLPPVVERPGGATGRLRQRTDPAAFDRALEGLLQKPTQAPKEPTAVPDPSIRFSRHAAARLESRGVALSDSEMGRLGEAIDQLSERGARESLVLLGDNAYVVGIPKRTVITAMPRSEALGTIFTNIDSTFVAS